MTDFDPITEVVDPAPPVPLEPPPATDVLRGPQIRTAPDPKQAYDALRTQGNAAYDTMTPIAGAAYGNRFVADRQAATEVQAKQQELQLRRDEFAARQAAAAGKTAGGGVAGTPVSPGELIKNKLVQQFGVAAIKDDKTMMQYVSLLDEDAQRALIDDYALEVGIFAPADKDNPAIAAGFDARARRDMVAALKSVGLAGPDERSTTEKLIGGAITLGGNVIGGAGDLVEGVDTILGGNIADTDLGKSIFDWTGKVAQESLSPQARQDQQAVQSMMALGMPTTDIVERVFTSPGLMTAYIGNFAGQMGPFIGANLLARVGARALGTIEARGLIAAAEGGATAAVDARAVNALRAARSELSAAVQRGVPAGQTLEQITLRVRAAETAVARSTAAAAAKNAAAAKAIANPLVKAATTGTAAEMAAGRVALRQSLQGKVLESMTKSAINASTIGLVVSAAGQYGMSKNQVRDTINALPITDLLASEENQRIYDAYAQSAEDRGMSPAGADALAAKELRRLLNDKAQEAAAPMAAASAGITALPLLSGVPVLGKLFAGMGTVERLAAGVEGKLAGNILTRPLKAAAFEGTQEGIQSGVEQVAANDAALTDAATAAALNVKDRTTNVLTQGVIGAGVGALAGGAVGGFAGPTPPPAVKKTNALTGASSAALPPVAGTQGTAAPAAAAATAGVPGAVDDAPGTLRTGRNGEARERFDAREKVGAEAMGVVEETIPDDIPPVNKQWWQRLVGAFGYRLDKTVSKTTGAKPLAASLFTFSNQWVAQAENESADLESRNKLFAPFMDSTGKLTDPTMAGLLAEAESLKAEFDAVAEGGKGKGRSNADALRKSYAPLNQRMAELDVRIGDAFLDQQAAAQPTTQENQNVQANTAPLEELTSLEQLGQLVPDSEQAGGTNPPAQARGMQQLRDGTGPADVFTPKEIIGRAFQPFAETPETVRALIRGLGKNTDMLARDSTINPRGLSLLRAYNAALQRGVPPAALANVLVAMPVKGKIDGARLTLARENIQALQAPVAPAAGGAVEDTELGKPIPSMMSSISPTSSGTPTAGSEALDTPPTYLPGMGSLEARKASMGKILAGMPIMRANDYVLVNASDHMGMLGELNAKLDQMVAQGKMTRAEATQMSADAIDHASGIPFDPLGFVLNSRGLHPLVVFNYGSPMYDATSSVTHVALHETAGHLGLRGLAAGREDLRVDILNMAARNKTVRELANALAPVWKLDPKKMGDWHAALEEALSELAAVGFTRDGLQQLSKTYGVNLTKNFSAKLENEDASVLQKVIQMLRQAWDTLTNLNTTDSEVRSVLASMNIYANSTTEARVKIRERALQELTANGTPRAYTNSLGKSGTVVTLYGAGDFSDGIDEIPDMARREGREPDELNARQGDGFTGQNALDIVFPIDMVNALQRQTQDKQPLSRRAWKAGSQVVETLFNSNWGLLREKEYIIRNGGTMNDDLDFYVASILGQGISTQNNEVDNQDIINPAMEQLAELYQSSGLSTQMSSDEFYIAVSDYIMARHAMERNTTFYYEMVELESDEANIERNRLLSEMRVTGMPTDVYMNHLRNIVLKGKPLDAYSDNATNYSGMTNKEAQDYLMKLDGEGITAEIGDAANQMMEEMRRLREQRALESGVFGEAGTNVQNTRGWKYYLPLRGKGNARNISEELEDYEEGPTTVGSRSSYSLYGAQGRSTKADNGIEALRGDVLLYGRRAGTRQYHSVLLRAMDANSDLMGVSIAVLDYDAASGMYKHRATGEYIKDLTPFTKGGAGESMLVVQSADKIYDPARKNNDTKYVIKFPAGGKESDILRALEAEKRQAITPMLANSGIGQVTGFVAKAQTSLNPFWMLMTSWVRDTTGYPAILTARLGLKEGAKVSQLYAATLAQNHLAGPMKVLFDGTNRRSLKDVREMAKEEGSWAYYYQRLMDLGGINSFDAQFETSAEDAFATQFKQETKLSGVKGAFNRYSQLAGTWADGLEASHRVAIFKALLDAGYSESAAAGLAKDLLNFQQVGSAGRDINTLIQFYKTSAASIDSMVRSFRNPDGSWDKAKAVQLGGVLAMGGALLTIFSAGMMGDDDEGEPYANRVRPDDWAKGMLVPTGDGSYRRIDVGLGFGGLAFGLGALSARLSQGQMDSGEYAASLFNVINRNAAPIQAAGVSKDATADEFAAAMVYGWAIPSLARPVIDITANRNNFGGNIFQNPAFTQGKADAFSGRPSTPDFFSSITEGVFKSTNGTLDVHPETLEYLISSYLGSMARMGMTFADIGHAEATGGMARKTAIDPFILPGVDTNKNWATDRMYNMQGDLDLAKARTGGEVASPAEAASSAFTDEINSIKSRHSKEMRKIRTNPLLSADARRSRIQALEADLNRKMILLEDQVERAKAAAR